MRRWPAKAANPVHTMNSNVKSLTMLSKSCIARPSRGAQVWTPTANDTAAIASPRSFQVVESTPAADRRYSEAVIALLAETCKNKQKKR